MDPKSHITHFRYEKYRLKEDGSCEPNSLASDLKNSIVHLSEGLYASKEHFIFELIQNAEDNKYCDDIEPSITFQLLHNDPTNTKGANGALIISNNETGFSKENIESICAVGKSTKNKQDGFIGEKGIGFKSIFCVTTTPFLFSNGYQISLPESHSATGLGFIVPEWVDQYPSSIDLSLTSIILPLDKPDFGYDVVNKMLLDIKPETILFLRKIKIIKILNDENEYIKIIKNIESEEKIQVKYNSNYAYINYEKDSAINKKQFPEKLVRQNIKLLSSKVGSEDEIHYFILFKGIFKRPEQIIHEKRNNINDREISVVFTLDGKVNNTGKLFAYLPVKSDTGFPFTINADFILPSSRENINDIPWNRDWLMPCVADLIFLCIPMIGYNQQISLQFLELLAKSVYNIDSSNIFYTISKAIEKSFLNWELIPTDNGSFVSSNKAILARGADLRDLIDHTQLTQLFESQKEWIVGEITQDKTPQLRSYLINKLNVEEVTPDVLARKINLKFLSIQSDDWFIKFYKYLSGQEALWRAPRYPNDSGGILRSKPIIRLENGNQEIPFKPDAITPKVFMPPPDNTTFPIIKRSIVADKQAETFLTRLGLSEPDIFDDIIERIFPKYTTNGIKLISEEEHQADIHKIIRAVNSDSEIGKLKVIQMANKITFIKGTNIDGYTIFKTPGEIYLKTPDLLSYFSESNTVFFIHKSYSSDIPDSFWRDIGVCDLPRKITTEEDVNWPIQQNGSNHIYYNYDLDGLKSFLHKILSKGDKSSEEIKLLCKIIKSCFHRDPSLFKAKYEWQYYKKRSKDFDSLIIFRLKNSEWILTKNGELKRPSSITIDNIHEDILESLDDIIDIIGIKSHETENITSIKYIESKITDDDIKFIKENRDVFEQFKLELEPDIDFLYIIDNNKSKDPERREKLLQEKTKELKERNYQVRPRITYPDDSAAKIAAKEYLLHQYSSKTSEDKDYKLFCQICQKKMPFKLPNGEYYFEKVQFISTNKRYRENYLALCPLHSAMFQYAKIDDEKLIAKNFMDNSTKDFKLRISGGIYLTIKFTETHMRDLQTVLREDKYFKHNQISDSE